MITRRAVLAAGVAALLPAWPAKAAKPSLGLVVPPRPQPLPELALVAESGATTLAAFAGRPVLLNLWASWCLPCVAELPALDRLTARRGPVEVVALSLDRRGFDAVRASFARLGITRLKPWISPDQRAGEVLGAPTLPTTLLIDVQGREAARFVGAAEWDGDGAAALLVALASGGRIGEEMAPLQLKSPATAP